MTDADMLCYTPVDVVTPRPGGCCNHATSSLLLSELFGMSTGEAAKRIQSAINKNLVALLETHRRPNARAVILALVAPSQFRPNFQ